MVRAIAEEGEDAGAGRRGRPLYDVGAKVEVLLNEQGFRGARYEATVAAHLPGSGGYEVVFSTLVAHHGGPQLRDVVAAAVVRPPPPPPPPGHEIKLFDLVEAYNGDGWWPGVVSDILEKEVVKREASLVRPRREFLCGRWMDAQDELRGIQLYAEGSSVEVMCDQEKKGTSWMPATIIKMIGGSSYAVSYGIREESMEVLHSCFIRPEPVFVKTKFEQELEPSAEVEVYHDGIWSVGVIEGVCSSDPRRYKVRVKHHGNTDEDDYFLVPVTSLRPYSRWDSQEWKPRSTKKQDRKRSDSVADNSSEYSISGGDSDQDISEYLPEFSTSAESSDQDSSNCSLEFLTSDREIDQCNYVPNKRVRKGIVKEELAVTQTFNLRKHTVKSSSKNVMDMETLPEEDGVKQPESKRNCSGFRVANVKGQILALAASVPQEVIYTQCDGKERCSVPKALASKRKAFHSVSPLDDTARTSSRSNYFDVVVISDDSGYGNFIEISDTSISDDSGYGNFIEISDTSRSCPNRKKRRMNLPDKELRFNHSAHQYQASQSASNLPREQNHHRDLVLEVTRYSEKQSCSHVLSDSLFPLESSQKPSHKDGGQLIPLPSLDQGHHRINVTEELELSDYLHLETAMMTLGDSAAGDEPHQSCQKVAEVKSWMAGACKDGADISLINSRNSDQKTLNQSCGRAFPIGKVEPCVQQDVNANPMCIEAPHDNKMEIETESSVMSPKEETAFTNGKLESSSSGQQNVKADLLSTEAHNDNKLNTISSSTASSVQRLQPNQMLVTERHGKMEIKNERTIICPNKNAVLPTDVLEPSTTGQQDVKADLLGIEAPNDNNMEVKNIRTGMYLEAAEGFDRETSMMIANVAHHQHNVSSEESFGQLQVSISGKSAKPSSSEYPSMMMDLSAFKPLPVPRSEFFTSSLLLMPPHKLEIFESLPQIPHFREVWKYPPEFREGTALGLMLSFANMAESIRNMQIQDEARVYEQKMSSLLDLEENGFQVGPLKVRLHNLLSTRNRQIDLKNKKTSLEKEILEIELTNCSLEQQVKILDMCIMGMEEQKYQERKVFIDTQKAANCCSISKLQASLHSTPS